MHRRWRGGRAGRRAGLSLKRPRELSLGLELFPARTPTLPPATHTNSYALGGRDVLLVEPATPYEDEQRAWLDWARGLVSAGRRLRAVFVTHHHKDHVGGVDVLARELGVEVWAHPWTAQAIGAEKVARTLDDGDAIVLDGPVTQRWNVLHTPGHAPGHLCLWNPVERAVVVGDMVASVGTILIAPGDGDMRVYLEQLERLGALDAHVALPSHGDPIDKPSRLFRHYVLHRVMRENKILAAVGRAGPAGATAQELVPDAYADTGVHLWPLALLSLRAHLAKLEAEGRVRADGERFVEAR